MLEHSLGIMHECCSQMLPYLLLCAPREILTLKKSQKKLGSEDVLVIFSSHQIFMLAPSTTVPGNEVSGQQLSLLRNLKTQDTTLVHYYCKC